MSNEKILRRIKKCLALSKSSNPHEAATAVRLAQKLMKENGLDEFEVRVNKEVSGIKLNVTLQNHVDQLIRFVASAFGCNAILNTNYKMVERKDPTFGFKVRRPSYFKNVCFVGESYSAKIAVYAFENLHRAMIEARKEFMDSLHGNSKKKTKSDKSDAYALGWVIAVGKNLPSMDVCDATQADKEAYLKKHFGSLDDTEFKEVDRHKFMNQMADGYEDGRHVNVHAGVGGSQNERSGLGYIGVIENH